MIYYSSMKILFNVIYNTKNPYTPSLQKSLYNKLKMYLNKFHFKFLFLDYNPDKISKQTKQIYTNIYNSINNKNDTNKDLYLHYCTPSVLKMNAEMNILKQTFSHKETYDWKVVNSVLIFNGNLGTFISPNESYAQLTMEYKVKQQDGVTEETKYILFQRNIVENVSYHSWKVLIPDYETYMDKI